MIPRLRTLLFLACLFLCTRSAPAQDRPAVFLHGLGAEASDWAETADRLRQTIALEPHIPSLPWRSMYQMQVKGLQTQAEFAALPTNTVAVGHSNGGVVAREWSKSHKLGGIVTIGTPHRGAPVMANMLWWSAINAEVPDALNVVVNAFSQESDWTWVYAYIHNALRWASDFSIWSVVNLATLLGVTVPIPVAAQMIPQSTYLLDLNGGSNLSREAADVPNRVGIVSVAHNYYFAGPARAIAPEFADEIAVAMYSAAFALLYWSDYIFFEAGPSDIVALQQSLSLLGAAGYILAIDPTYCGLVSRWDMTECLPNDGIVAVDSQSYPDAPNLLVGANNDGPAHQQEKQRSDDALYTALTAYMHVPPRNGPVLPAPTPMPPPVPPPSPAPAPPADVPEPMPEPPPPSPEPPPPAPEPPPPAPEPTPEPAPEQPPPDPEPAPEPVPEPEPARPGPKTITTGLLFANEYLFPGDAIDSTNGQRHVSYQGDGNLVIYDEQWQPLWASGTAGMRAGVVAMQGDGNFVVYDPDGVPLWAAGTAGHPGAYLAVQNDGNVVIYEADGTPLWATDTFIY